MRNSRYIAALAMTVAACSVDTAEPDTTIAQGITLSVSSVAWNGQANGVQNLALFGDFPAGMNSADGHSGVILGCTDGSNTTARITAATTSRLDVAFDGAAAPRECAITVFTSLDGNPVQLYRYGGVNIRATSGQIFTDVPPWHPYYEHIQVMGDLGITNGTTPTTFSPDQQLTRGQMAVFVIRAINLTQANGIDLLGGMPDNFTAPTTPYFDDVPPSHPYFKWIQKMKELGITAGCGPTTYCPDDPITQGQMAVFATRAKYRENFYSSPTPYFPADIPAGHPFFRYVQKMRDDRIWCGAGYVFNTDDNQQELAYTSSGYPATAQNQLVVTRGDMAAILTRQFWATSRCTPQ